MGAIISGIIVKDVCRFHFRAWRIVTGRNSIVFTLPADHGVECTGSPVLLIPTSQHHTDRQNDTTTLAHP